MIGDYSNKTAIVLDNGIFVSLAETLSKYFKKVYYYSPWEGPFPKSNERLVGYGIPGVERCNQYWKKKNEIDLWVFPDIYFEDTQYELVKQGRRVWGARDGDDLELHRKEAKEHFKSLGLEVGPYKVIKGIPALREFLKKNKDQSIKVSLTRGDFETFHSENYEEIEPKLDSLEHTIGSARKNTYEFIVEAGINDAVEIGYDGYTVDGKFPTCAMMGIETKGNAYVGVFKDYVKMPRQIREINEKLSVTLQKYKYRNFFAVETRIKKDGSQSVIDPCCRMGAPPGELIQVMYMNLPDIIWYGAEGKCIDPEQGGKYGAEILMHSSWAADNWLNVQFPKEIAQWVKLRNYTIIDGKNYVMPQNVGVSTLGGVVALADTMDEAVKLAYERAEQVKGYQVEIDKTSLNSGEEEIEKLKKFGIIKEF